LPNRASSPAAAVELKRIAAGRLIAFIVPCGSP
jgi:hypothetical protein